MSARYSAARPKRDGEAFARAYHNSTDHDDSEPNSKKVKFDLRNPSALAPTAGLDDDDEKPDEPPDLFLEADADVIRGSAAVKRGAVNIDGYDSDSDREEFGERKAREEKKAKLKNKHEEKRDDGMDDVDDMFAATKDDDGKEGTEATVGETEEESKKKSKQVHFLSSSQIEGQDTRSRDKSNIRLDDADSSSDDDEETVALSKQEEAVDEEVGAAGLKKHAPKVEAFNLKAEESEGRFDEAGNFVRNAVDRDAQHDRWLDGISRKDMKKAAAAHEKREADLRRKRLEDADILTSDLLKALVLELERGETALEALARLGRRHKARPGKPKKIPKWKQKKASNRQQKEEEDMDVDGAGDGHGHDQAKNGGDDPIKDAIDTITDAADKLLSRDRPDVYDRERELLVREWTRETDEPWVEPAPSCHDDDGDRESAHHDHQPGDSRMWEFKWTDGRDSAAKQGPFDAKTMKAWQDAGYFGEGVEFRLVGHQTWSRVLGW